MARIVLRADVDGVGKKGDVLEVADGYARNFLIPKGHAIKATPGVQKQAAAMRRSRDLKDAKDRESAEVVARTLVPVTFKIAARAGAEGKLFGSVTAMDIVEAVQKQSGVQLDRRRVHLDEPIKTVGVHEVPIRLHPEVQFRVTVEVAGGG